jgi:hypothetical protein
MVEPGVQLGWTVVRRVCLFDALHGNLAGSNDKTDDATRSNGCETDLYDLIKIFCGSGFAV